MKSLTLYICDVCGTQYKNKTECERCEARHAIPQKVIHAVHKNTEITGHVFPTQIIVEFHNGKMAQYNYVREAH